MITAPRPTKAPTIKRVSVKNWIRGTITAYDDGRTPVDGLRSSGNVVLDQDGTVRPRPSLSRYGPQPTGTILGEVFEFKNVSGLTSTTWMASLQNVSGTTKVYIAKGEDTSWTVCNGKTYDNTATARFLQIGNKVLVLNGTDALSYLDIPTSTVIPFTALTTPSAPTIANNGSTNLTTAGFLNIYYAVTASSTVGETIGSASTTQSINADRDLWNPATQSLKITWSAVTGAKNYNLYMAIAAPGGLPTLYLLKPNIDPNTLNFVDDGSLSPDTTHPIPTTDSTAGPKASRGAVINGRVFLVGDKDQPFYVRYGGDFGFELDFSPANGGGFTPVGSGTKEVPVAVKPFRDGRGNAQITVLCQGTNGRGKRYILTPDSLTFASQIISFYDVTEDNGQDGTDSPDGVILYNDSLWYPSRDGFKTTGTKPQLQNVLSTDRVSNTIQGDIKTLNNAAMNKCVGLGFEGRLYWAVPVGSTSNNEIWVLDLDRQGAWMKPWSVSADWMWLYNDNSGTSHHLILSNNVISEFTYAQSTSDNGTAFATTWNSGQIGFSPDMREWGKVIQLVFVFLRLQGNISITVAGKTEDSSLAAVGSASVTPTTTIAGWSEPSKYIIGWGRRAWSKVETVPVQFNSATTEVIVEVDEELQWYQYGGTTTTVGVSYQLADVIAEYVEIGIKDLT